jgi:hypothetical protein
MLKIFSFFIGLSLLNLNVISALTLKGVAKSIDGKEVLYSEEHQIELDEKGHNKNIRTRYLKPDGRLFATMESDFSKNKLVPEIKFEDLRFNRKEFLLIESEKLAFKKKIGSQDEATKYLPLLPKSVAGQGFDNFIKINFEELTKGEVALDFGVLSEMDIYSFKAYKKESDASSTQFGISLTNPFLRMFAKELVVTYDPKTKQLLRYRGLSNILDDQSSRQNVQIDYEVIRQ